MKTLLYLHGLGSSANSKKFIRLQEEFTAQYQVVCPEWTVDTNIDFLLNNLFNKYQNDEFTIIIGSSTGGNFGFQLANLLRQNGVKVKLILINPLLNLVSRITSRPFPTQLARYLHEIKEVNECTLILSLKDEVIDHSQISVGKAVQLFEIDDNHRVDDLEKLIFILRATLQYN